MKRIILILICFYPLIFFGQNANNLKIKKIYFKDTIKIDSFLLVFNSVELFSDDSKVSDTLYIIDYSKSEIIFKDSIKGNLKIKYRFLNYNFHKTYFSKDTSLIAPFFSEDREDRYEPTNKIDEILNSDGLTKKGTIERGISVGSNQEPVVNSKLNLQLVGKLSNDLYLEAAISDETMPIQPDGNTAQIQDINKIFIRVSGKKSQLTAGDFIIQKPKSYFLNYSKQTKGLKFSTKEQKITKKATIKSSNSGVTISKGKYYRQKIKAVEGNQGPYKLQGANGETFIIIISGSERIYIDNKLMSRGETADYSIDYNSAEITFTPNCPITKDSRIIAEFEYSERNYSRFTFFSNNEFSVGKNDFFFNMYSEGDAKNQTIDADLTDDMKLLLSEVGDSVQLAEIQHVDSVAFDVDMVMYRKVDTVIDNEIYSYYEHSTNPENAHYRLSFAYIGDNAGNYVIDNNQVNGRIYKWVKPENGVPQGNYETTTVIVAPKKKQMYDFGGRIAIQKNKVLDFEIAVTNTDLNLFSDKHDNDNIGKAFRLNFSNFFKGNDSSAVFSKTWINYEYTGKNFNPIEVYKSQEFERNWNINKTFFTDEHIGQIGYKNSFKNGLFSADFKSLFHKNEYFGGNSNLFFTHSTKDHKVLINNDLLYSKENVNSTKFLRSKVDAKQRISKFFVGTHYNQETNLWKNTTTNDLQQNSYMFHAFGFYVENSDSSKNSFKLNYIRRLDYLTANNRLLQTSSTNDFNLTSNFNTKIANINATMNYRQLFIKDTTLADLKPENNLSARIGLNFSILNRAFVFNSVGLVYGGLEQKLQFIYIEVEPSKGVYTWIDYNGDGLKQIDEFEVANYSDQANFVRVPLQSNEYIKVYGKNISQTIAVNPQNLFKENTKIHHIASKFTNYFSFNIEHKSYSFNVFNFADTNAVKFLYFVNNILNFRVNKELNISYLWQKNKSVLLLVSGLEKNEFQTNKITGKYKLTKELSLNEQFIFNDKKAKSFASAIKNYNIIEKTNILSVLFSTNNTDLGIDYSYSDRRNIMGDETLFSNMLKISGSSSWQKNQVSAELNIINNNFRGDASTNIAYSMLEGLKPDFNLTWLINVKRQLGKTLQLTFSYSGRYAKKQKIINTGSVNLVAYF